MHTSVIPQWWRLGRSPPPRPSTRSFRTLALLRQSASSAPAVWGLNAARRYPRSLAVWARKARVWDGVMHGDTAEVIFYTNTNVCDDRPIWLRFVGESGRYKVVEAGSSCFDLSLGP